MDRKNLEGWEIMRIKGIPLFVHPSWFLILMLFTWTAKTQISNEIELSLPVWFVWGLGLSTSLLLFLSVLLHELGHSFVALHEGVKVKSITLFLLGGVARIERECQTAMGSLRVALAGPLVSLLIAFILLFTVDFNTQINPLIANLLTQLGRLNLVLALFNLLPGLPLDGGVIVKSLVWYFTGNKRKGIQVANASGSFLSIFAIFIGFWMLIKGGGFSGLWLIMIGWFGFSAARSQNQVLTLQRALTELFVSGSKGKRFRVLEGDQPLRKLSQMRIISDTDKSLQDWVLICQSGRWIGYINDQPLKDLPVQNWDNHCIKQFTNPIEELPSISDKSCLWEAVLALENSKEGRLLVLNLAGLPSGTIEKADVGKAVLNYLGVRLPDSFIKSARMQNSYPLGMQLPQVVESMISSGMIDLPSKLHSNSSFSTE